MAPFRLFHLLFLFLHLKTLRLSAIACVLSSTIICIRLSPYSRYCITPSLVMLLPLVGTLARCNQKSYRSVVKLFHQYANCEAGAKVIARGGLSAGSQKALSALQGRSAVRPPALAMHECTSSAMRCGRESFETFMRSEGLDENKQTISFRSPALQIALRL